jgi:hypothetical protein
MGGEQEERKELFFQPIDDPWVIEPFGWFAILDEDLVLLLIDYAWYEL